MLYLKVDQISLKMGEHERNREELSGILTVRAHIFSGMFVYSDIEEFRLQCALVCACVCTGEKEIFHPKSYETANLPLFSFSSPSQVAIIGTRKKKVKNFFFSKVINY